MYDLAATIKANPNITEEEIKTKFPELIQDQAPDVAPFFTKTLDTLDSYNGPLKSIVH
jgi:hypothetical protein